MPVTASPLPPSAGLRARFRPGDFLDCWSCATPLAAPEVARILVGFPFWVRALLALRTLFVLPFGLRTGAPRPGRYGRFPVESESDEAVTLGFDDRHLDFRIEVRTKDGRAWAATWVRPHGRLGRTYLAAVLPFHRLILRDALARVEAAAPN